VRVFSESGDKFISLQSRFKRPIVRSLFKEKQQLFNPLD